MLHVGESQRTIDSQEPGMFRDMYAHHGSQEVPSILRACELLTPGEKVVYDNNGELVFAGLIFARSYDYLPTSINLTRWHPNDPETATISIPLHSQVTYSDRWGAALTGGGANRYWQDVCKLILEPMSIDESDLAGKVLSVGVANIRKRMAKITNPLTRQAMELVIQATEDVHYMNDQEHIEGLGSKK